MLKKNVKVVSTEWFLTLVFFFFDSFLETCTYENQATVNNKKVNETSEKLIVNDTRFFKNLFETSYYFLCNSSSIENTSPEGLYLRKISRKDKLLLKNFLVTVLLYDMCYMSVWWKRLRNINRSHKIQNTASQSALDTSQPIIDPLQENDFFLLNSSSLKAIFSLTLLHRSKATQSLQKVMSSCFRLSSEIFLQFHTTYSRFPLRLKPSFSRTDFNFFRSFSIDPLKTRKHANFDSISHKNGTIALDRLQRTRSRTVEPTRNLLNKKRKNWTVLMNDIFSLVSDPSFRDSFYSKISVLPSISNFDFTTQSCDESSLSIEYMNRLPSVLDTTVAFCIASICMFSLKALNTQELTRFSFRDNWMLTSHNTTVLEKPCKKNESFSLNDYVLKLSKSHQKPDFSTMNFTKEETVMVNRLLNVIVFKKEHSYALLSCKILMGHSPFVTLISGASGCGKSTLALHLGSKLGCIKVITTDTIRHVCCSMGVKNTVSILKASTYEADVVLQKLNPLERQFLEEHYGKPLYDAGPFSKCIEGYLMQSRLLYETINNVVESCIQKGNSIVLEGILHFIA